MPDTPSNSMTTQFPDQDALMQALAAQPQGAMSPGAPAPGTTPPPAAMPPPDVSQPMTPTVGSGPGGTVAPPEDESQQNKIPSKIGAAPLLARMLQAAFKPPPSSPATGGGPGNIGAQPGAPGNRVDQFEGFLGEFLDSFSKGMANAGAGPAANARGFGAAVQAPYEQQVRQYQMGQAQQAQQSEIAQRQAETERTQAQTQKVPVQPYGPTGPTIYMSAQEAKGIYQSQIAGQARIEAAGAQKQFLTTPFGVFNTETRQYEGGGSGGGIGATVQMTKAMADSGQYGPGAQQLIGKQVKLSDLSGMERSNAQGTKMVQGATGPAAYNVGTGQSTVLGLGAPGASGPVQVGNPNSPGNTMFVSGQQAMQGGMAGPGSASVQIPLASLRYMTSGPGGQMMTAYRTATDHMLLLSQLGRALENGDYTAYNDLAARWKTATGSAAPPNFALAREALAGEASKAFSGAGTVSGIDSMKDAILKAPNMDQLDGMVRTMTALMQGKQDELMKQHAAAMKGQPVTASPSASATPNDAAAANAFLLKHPPAKKK